MKSKLFTELSEVILISLMAILGWNVGERLFEEHNVKAETDTIEIQGDGTTGGTFDSLETKEDPKLDTYVITEQYELIVVVGPKMQNVNISQTFRKALEAANEIIEIRDRLKKEHSDD